MRDVLDLFMAERDKRRFRSGEATLPCQAEGCSRRTRERKPYCPTHVAMHAYVQQVLAMDEQYRREEVSVVPNVDGMIAGEIVTQLAFCGPRTAARLARDLRLTGCAVLRHLIALRRAGRVRKLKARHHKARGAKWTLV